MAITAYEEEQEDPDDVPPHSEEEIEDAREEFAAIDVAKSCKGGVWGRVCPRPSPSLGCPFFCIMLFAVPGNPYSAWLDRLPAPHASGLAQTHSAERHA